MAQNEMVSVSEAVRVSGLSSRTLKRMAEEGRLKFSRSPGGHMRIARADLDGLLRQSSNARDTRPTVSTVQNMRDEVEIVDLEVKLRQAKQKLASIEAEDQAAKRETAGATRAQELADKRALAEMRLDRIRKREERDAAHAQEIAQRERADWVREITTAALGLLPRNIPPDVKAAAIESIHDALASLGPTHSQQVIAIAVSGAITRALAPWRHHEEIERAIEEAERTLPWDMRAIAGPTEWQLRFRAAAEAAISALRPGTPLGQIRAAAQSEAKKLVAEFVAFEQRKNVTERAERSLHHVAAYVEQLGGPDGKSDLGDYLDRCKLARKLKNKIRPDLVEAMLAGEIEDDEDAQNFIEDAVDSMVGEVEE